VAELSKVSSDQETSCNRGDHDDDNDDSIYQRIINPYIRGQLTSWIIHNAEPHLTFT
jgi:hypothetical protein